MTRRVFMRTVSAAAAAGPAVGLTTISYNVLACAGFPETPATRGRLTAARGQMEARMAQELLLYRPDIITFCESVSEPAAGRIAKLLGMRYAWFAPGVSAYPPAFPIGFPGTVFTRYRIVESENAPYGSLAKDAELFTRHWGRAVLDTGEERIAVFSGHLFPHAKQVRDREVTVMLHVLRREMEKGGSILFQGDLNHTPDGPEYRRWVDAGLVDTLAALGDARQATYTSIAPQGRIDYIWAGGPLAKRLRAARVLNEGAFRTNPEDPASFALSDHMPVLARFE